MSGRPFFGLPGLRRTRPGRTRGMTLIELLVTIAIAAMLLKMGVPMLTSWIVNVRIRNAADSLQNGIRLAQSNAIKNNASVTLKFTSAATPTTSSTVSGTGVNWFIVDAGGNLLQAKGSEGQSGVTLTTYDSSGTALSFGGSITFDALGRISSGISQSTRFQFGSANSQEHHDMAVFVTTAGRVRMCDPRSGLTSSDPQYCG